MDMAFCGPAAATTKSGASTRLSNPPRITALQADTSSKRVSRPCPHAATHCRSASAALAMQKGSVAKMSACFSIIRRYSMVISMLGWMSVGTGLDNLAKSRSVKYSWVGAHNLAFPPQNGRQQSAATTND